MTTATARDSRVSDADKGAYERALAQATALQQESASVSDSDPATTDGASVHTQVNRLDTTLRALTRRVDRLESARPSPSGTDAPAGPDTSVSNAPSNGSPTATSRVVDPVTESFSWPWPWPPPPLPVLSHQQGPDFIDAQGIAGNAWVDTTAFLTDTGRLQATTHVQAQNLFAGCTTGTIVVITDDAQNVIARSEIQQIGVDGTWVPFKESNRTVTWSEDFGADVAARARGMYVGHIHAGRNRLIEDINELINIVTTLPEFVAQFCQKYPDLCSVIATAFA